MNRRLTIALVAGLTFGFAGCNNYLTEVPQDFFSPDNFPSTEDDLRIALAGIDTWYTNGANQPYFIRGWPMLTEVPSDQTINQTTSDSRYEQDTFTANSSNEWLWRVWRQVYGASAQANTLIERIPQMTAVPQAVKDRYLGAALYHRAFNHFNAVRVWGSVPLDTVALKDFSTVSAVTRAPIPDIYASIIADLTRAATLLPLKWPDALTPDDGRPTRGAANAMLADAYMNMSGVLVQQNHWADAAAAAKAVIDSKAYSLVPNFGDLWLVNNKNGPEHIYSIQFEGLILNLFTVQSRPSGIGAESGFNYWYSTPEFMASFSDSDARKKPTFLTSVTVGTTTYSYTTFGNKKPRFPNPMPYYGKFYDDGGHSITLNAKRSDLNWPIYRYAEVLLMFAEAENEAVGPDVDAYAAINQVRARATLPPLAGLTQDTFRDAVHQERSWELAFESKRLFDLKRWGTFYSVLSQDPVAKIGIKPTSVWSPIPQREIDLNPNLGQNPGY
ncbi:MAG TPA: RagB/SusD family nutrient uptake outer membrane protein [Gemmatimonadaceae bacterium]|jgi:hypothetical protein